MSDAEDALRRVWLTHRDSVIADLSRLSESLIAWNEGTHSHELATTIQSRAHRICGALTIVGRRAGLRELRELENRAISHRGPYATEVVDDVHDLLTHLRDDC